ncbi:MAG: sulfite exporter TauE/SafE family protein [Candidatus Omnitrophica bacterium]|nr:sulfite exporter TauE/SafE family protein [Candidatus Omnitrophota bacterium]
MEKICYILLGLLAGVLSGLMGIGGGLIIIPVLVLLFKFTQHQAQGTTLALMVPPIGLLAAWAYYKNGDVNLVAALFICLGFFVGGLFGANLAFGISGKVLTKVFGVVMVLIGIKMIFSK